MQLPLTSLSLLVDHVSHCAEELRSKQLIKFDRIIPISAREQTNIGDAKRAIREVLDAYAERELLQNEETDDKITAMGRLKH